MSFNLEKYLVENNLTMISRKRQALKEEEDQPSAADVQSAEKQIGGRSIDRKIKEYNALKKELDVILDKYFDKKEEAPKDPKGKKEVKRVLKKGVSMQDYSKEVGNIPARLKSLKADIEKVKTPDVGSEEQD